MSGGAVFKLLLRDDRFDNLFTAAGFLRGRLAEARARRGGPAALPDLTRTHLLFVHATYRPYVDVASEYARVPAAGDGAVALGAGERTVEFSFPSYGHFTSDMVLHVRFPPVGAPAAGAPLLRYCAYPGARLLRRVALRAPTLLDEYTPDDVAAYGKFFVGADQLPGWRRCLGQQEPRTAAFLGNGFTGLLAYSDGPQTPKLAHEGLELFIPLLFWFCGDAARALPNDLLPNTRRTVTCALAPLDEILAAAQPAPGGALVPAPLPFATLPVSVDLYVNNLYVSPEVHDVFAARVGFSLVRLHRRQHFWVTSPVDSYLLDGLKFPTEFLTLTVRARALAADFDRWWLSGVPRARPATERLLAPAMVWNPAVGGGICELVCREAREVTALDSPVESLGVTAHGIELHPRLPALFYNAYAPLRYAPAAPVVAPQDTAVFLVTFGLYPGRPQPSGYYNLSSGRELYVDLALRGEVAPGSLELVVAASALNFIVRRGDTVSLRYTL